jgi:hypothetical protein
MAQHGGAPTFAQKMMAKSLPVVPPHRRFAATVQKEAAPTTASMATPTRLPPHRRFQQSSTVSPTVEQPTEVTSRTLHDQSAAPSPKRFQPGPHTKLGPHARKAADPVPATVSSVSASVDEHVAASSITALPTSLGANAYTPQEEQSKQDALTRADDKMSSNSKPTDSMAGPKTGLNPVSTTEVASPSIDKKQCESQVEKIAVVQSEHTDKDGRHYGRGEWLSMMLAMGNSPEGRELIKAFADHIRAGTGVHKDHDAVVDAQQKLWMEFCKLCLHVPWRSASY